MATTQTDVRAKGKEAQKNTRRNEIIGISLFAVGVLLALCLATYRPNDPSWNTGAQGEARNLIGAIGANISAALFQSLGLSAILLLLLLFIAAWQRFRLRRIEAPFWRVVGSAVLILAASALFSLFIAGPLVDASIPPGGMLGALVTRIMVSWLNTVGTAILLFAALAIGLLLATNFSFVRTYEWIGSQFGNRFQFFRAMPERFSAWRAARRERALQRVEMRRMARAEREAVREDARREVEKTGAERVAEFMQEALPSQSISAGAAIQRNAAASKSDTTKPSQPNAQTITASTAQAASGGAEEAQAVTAPPVVAKRGAAGSSRPAPDQRGREEAEIEEMVRDASVVRTELEEEKIQATEARGAERTRRAPTAAVGYDDYRMPEVEFLKAPPPHSEQADEELLGLATRLAEKCKEFNVTGQIKHICPGPVVTTYEFKPDPGVKYSRVTGLVDDLCLALKAESIRIDRMPGKPHVGIEVPNPERETIHLREVVESRQYRESESKITIALGKTIDGLNYVADLARMPHLLIAGATGTGKSVAVNSLIVSILYKARPDEVKFILVDPKRLELGLYEGIPHLATPIITEPKRATSALKWAVREMEERYKRLAGWSVRNIDGFNTEVARRNFAKDYDDKGEPHKPLPYIVIIIDELADLMMVSGHEVEESITRLAQMARAVGIHLVLATQRPSVDVITGLIKANFPSRISFRVSSKVDSRTIIDANGAEQLLGRGDMLFLPPGTSRLVRVHGAYVDETEIGRIVSHIKAQGEPSYDETITQTEEEAMGLDGASGERDELFEDALRICVEMKRASTSVLQRRLRIGYGRAAAILDMMEREGFIGQADGARPRPVLGRAYEMVSEWDEQEQQA